MSIIIKTPEEIRKMREGGKILREILIKLGEKVLPGIKTCELEKYAEELFRHYNVKASFKGYRGYPASICTAVNEEVVHAIPGERVLHEGDIISIDAGVFHEGLHTDSAITCGVGKISEEKRKFIQTCEQALRAAIAVAKEGIKIEEISGVIQDIVEKEGYSIVKDLIGHGVGKNLHEEPEVPNFRTRHVSPILRKGMTIAIEPIIAMGKGKIKVISDGWTIITKDRSDAAQVEHTIAITENGCEILTA